MRLGTKKDADNNRPFYKLFYRISCKIYLIIERFFYRIAWEIKALGIDKMSKSK